MSESYSDIPQIEHGGPEWFKAMLELDKDTIVKMFRKKIKEVDLQVHCSNELREGLTKAANERDELKNQYDGAKIQIQKLQTEVDDLQKEKEAAEHFDLLKRGDIC